METPKKTLKAILKKQIEIYKEARDMGADKSFYEGKITAAEEMYALVNIVLHFD